MTAAEAIAAAKQLIETFGWPAYSPWDALKAMEKKMRGADDPQIMLMWDVCTRQASKVIRRGVEGTMLHPVRYIHVQEGQTKAGISEYLADCAEIAQRHPLNGTTHAPTP